MSSNKVLKQSILILITIAAVFVICFTAVPSYAGTSDVVYYDTEKEAVKELREHMKQREKTITVGLKGSIDQEGLEKIIGRIFVRLQLIPANPTKEIT